MDSSSSPPPLDAQLLGQSREPLRIILEQPKTRLGTLGRRLLWTALFISILVNFSLFGTYQTYFQGEATVQERYHSLRRDALDKVAVINIDGLILSSDGFVKKQIDRVRQDEHVKAVVLRVDSPGGTVTASDYIYHHLKELAAEKKIPIVVSMGSIAASGGYYVAMAAGRESGIIFAEPTTWTGSIGVIIPHYDVSGLLGRWNIQDDSIASHPLKQLGSPTRSLSDEERREERRILQELVDESFAGFKKVVLESRPALEADPALRETAFTGRIFTAAQAKRQGLVDEIGFLEDAIDRAVKLAKLSKDQTRAVHYVRPAQLADLLLGGEARGRRFDPAALFDPAAPQACYLFAWPSLGQGLR